MTLPRLAVRIRPAVAGDTPQVLELLSHIWEGQDYVPALWDEWLHDMEGRLVVAEYQERIAGLGRLSRLSADEWWLQGLRVHPDFESRGVASQLHDYLVNDWRMNFGGTLRLSTVSTRYPVHHLCERTGFQKIAEISVFRAPAKIPDPEGAVLAPVKGTDLLAPLQFHPLYPQDTPTGLAFIQDSPLFELQCGLWALGWEWVQPTLELLQDAVQRGHAWWWRERQGLLVILMDEEDEPPVPFIQHLACPLEDLADCLEDFRRLAGHLGYAQAAWEAPLLPPLLNALEQAGFQRTWDGAIFLYSQRSAVPPRS